MSRDRAFQEAIMKPGDFHLRRNDRQMFGNYVLLSLLGGSAAQKNIRRSAMYVATPVYDVPKLWWLDVQFELTENSSPSELGPGLTPWVPAALDGNIVRVTVTHAIDRDKQTVTEVFDLHANTSAANVQSALPTHLFVGHQVSVKVEIVGGISGAPLGTQVSLVEVTNDERDPYGNTTITRFAQSALSQQFLIPNKRRRQFFVVNNGTAPLYVAFSYFAVGPGAAAFYTYQLPNAGDVYESPRDCWQGYVSGIWSADGAAATDQALVTEGF